MLSSVKFWNSEKGFGYIDNGDQADILVTVENLKNCKFLKRGAKVNFDVAIISERIQALNVKLQKNHPGTRRHPSRPEHNINFVMT